MAEEIGLVARLRPELDRRAAEQEVGALDRMMDDASSVEPDVGTQRGGRRQEPAGGRGGIRSRLPGGSVRGAARRGVGLGGRFMAARALRSAGLPASVTMSTVGGMLGGGGDGGEGQQQQQQQSAPGPTDVGTTGSTAVGGMTAAEPQSIIELEQAQLAVQEEILEELEDMTLSGGDDGTGPLRGGGGGIGGLGALALVGAGGVAGGLASALSGGLPDINISEPDWLPPEIPDPDFLPPRIPDPEFLPPEIPNPEFLPIEITNPDWLPPEVIEPGWLPIEIPDPDFLPPEIPEPTWTPIVVTKPGWVDDLLDGGESPTGEPTGTPTGGPDAPIGLTRPDERPLPEPAPTAEPTGRGGGIGQDVAGAIATALGAEQMARQEIGRRTREATGVNDVSAGEAGAAVGVGGASAAAMRFLTGGAAGRASALAGASPIVQGQAQAEQARDEGEESWLTRILPDAGRLTGQNRGTQMAMRAETRTGTETGSVAAAPAGGGEAGGAGTRSGGDNPAKEKARQDITVEHTTEQHFHLDASDTQAVERAAKEGARNSMTEFEQRLKRRLGVGR